MRKALAGALIRLGRRIARPTVTVEPMRFRDDVDVNALISEQIRMSRTYAQDTRLPRLRLHGMDGTAWTSPVLVEAAAYTCRPTTAPLRCPAEAMIDRLDAAWLAVLQLLLRLFGVTPR